MKSRINLGLVPKNRHGYPMYSAIKSGPVRALVAEEEIRAITKKLKRSADPRDSFKLPYFEAQELEKRLIVVQREYDSIPA